jgi:outer membrane protein assembly factor BamD
MRSLAVLVVLLSLLSGCGLIPEKIDETAKWSANRLYTEGHDAMTEGAYDKAIKLFEKLEARYPYGRYSQQAQIETAYAQFKMNEPTSAIASCDRFIRLHPNHPNVDYAYYLKGLVNFNEDQGLLGKISAQDMTERDPQALKESFSAF